MQDTPSNIDQIRAAQAEQDQLSLAIFGLTEQLEAHKDRLKAVRAFLSGVNAGVGARNDELAADEATGDQA